MRVIIYDAVDRAPAAKYWPIGARAYVALGMSDRIFAAKSIDGALEWLHRVASITALTQVEWWCHGLPGQFAIGSSVIDLDWLRANRRSGRLRSIGAAVREISGVFWLRSCSSFAGPIGMTFAQFLAEDLGCTVAGHTHGIGKHLGYHSGLHTLSPEDPTQPWEANEGRLNGVYGAKWSDPWAINTIHATQNKIPKGW